LALLKPADNANLNELCYMCGDTPCVFTLYPRLPQCERCGLFISGLHFAHLFCTNTLFVMTVDAVKTRATA